MARETLSKEDQEFLRQCDEELKDRFTENDEEFMKVFNAEPSKPPIIENWRTFGNSGRGHNRYSNRRFHAYGRHENRDRRFRDNHHDSSSSGNDRRHNSPPRRQNDRTDNNDSRGYSDYQGFDYGPRRRY